MRSAVAAPPFSSPSQSALKDRDLALALSHAKAGDVVIWHHWTVHNGSENVNARPRLGVFSRFHHSDWQEMRWDHGGILTDHDLWKWWTPEVKAAPVNPARPLDAARL